MDGGALTMGDDARSAEACGAGPLHFEHVVSEDLAEGQRVVKGGLLLRGHSKLNLSSREGAQFSPRGYGLSDLKSKDNVSCRRDIYANGGWGFGARGGRGRARV